MKSFSRTQIFLRIVVSFVVSGLFAVWQPNDAVTAQNSNNNVLYTTDADFDLGSLVSVNHDVPYNNQLQLNSPTEPFPFINVAASGRGTVVRANTETGEIVGEYRTAPEGRGLNPSRTTVDLFGNVWTANRDEVGEIDGVPHGSAVKIGLIVGGTRVNENGSPNPDGSYLAPPFAYNTCVDRNGDGLIRTSKGLADILDWPDITDGVGGTDGLVQDAVDECILIYQRLYDAEQARHVSVDADNNVWVGGYPFVQRMFYKLDGASGAVLDSFDSRDIGCGGYGGLVDGNGILWSVGGALLRYDPVARTGFCIQQYGYGLGIDTNGYIWMSLWDGGIVKIAPDGTVMPGFPKPTFVTPVTASSMKALEMSSLATKPQREPDGLFNFTGSEDAWMSVPKSLLPAPTPSFPPGNDSVSINKFQEAQALVGSLEGDPAAAFQVSPVYDWVQSYSAWTPGATITLTIEEGGGVVYSDSQVAESGGNFLFNLMHVFNLKRGHVVTVSDGTTIKTHTVMDLFVDGVDVAADAVFGRSVPGSSVETWVDGDGAVTVTTDGSGSWTANFTGQTDLTYFTSGGTRSYDDDGDSTAVWWSAPRIQVAPAYDWVHNESAWNPDTTITLTIQDSGIVVYSDSQVSDPYGNFFFSLWNVFDLKWGQVVTVSDGINTKTLTVPNLFVDSIDVPADVITGRADAGAYVEVWVDGYGGLSVTADGTGNWTADFSDKTDLTWFSNGHLFEYSSDGDSTFIWWSTPRFQTSPVDDWVQSSANWPPGKTITMTVEDGGEVVYSDTQVTDPTGRFHFNLWNVFDLQRGQTVTITDGTTTKSHTVMPLYVDGVNVANDTIFGRADTGADVDVWVNGDGGTTITPDGSGNWTADFFGQTDLTYLSDGGSQQFDSEGDSTFVSWSSPRIEVSPQDEWVQSWSRWQPGVTITLTIEDGGAVVYSDSQTTDSQGNFHFNFMYSTCSAARR